MIAYSVTFFSLNSDILSFSILVPIVSCGFSAYRVGEILSVFVQLHLQREYSSEAPARAVLNTFWHYGEFAFAFATFYAVTAKWWDPELVRRHF